MKKWTIILHSLGALGCIGGIFGLASYGWIVFQWPIIALVWIVTSFVNAMAVDRLEKNEKLMDERHNDLNEQLVKAQTELHKAQFSKAKKVNLAN